ncbi:MAG: VWA-like domain-containing protein [Candidatus Micrarchaeaceae archaeon]
MDNDSLEIIRLKVAKIDIGLFWLLKSVNVFRVDSEMLAYTTGSSIYLSNEFFTLENKDKLFVVLHELLHILLIHVKRIKEYKLRPALYNLAADYIVNNLIYHTIVKCSDEFKNSVIFNLPNIKENAWQTESAETVYNMLVKYAKSLSFNGSLSNDIKNTAFFNYSETNDSSQNDKRQLQKGDEEFTSPDADIEEQVRKLASFSHVASQMSRIFEMANPRVPWKILLRRKIKAKTGNTTWSIPNRRLGNSMPGYKKSMGHDVFIFLDTSGSISTEDLSKFFAEVKNLSIQKNINKMVLIQWSNGIDSIDTYPFKDLKVSSKGGTEFYPVWADFKNKVGLDDVVIILSDFYVDDRDMNIFLSHKDWILVSTGEKVKGSIAI